MSMKDKNSFRIWQFTDPHLYADCQQEYYGVKTDVCLKAILDHALAANQQAHLALVTGDLVHDGSQAAYQRLAGYLKTLSAPIHCLAGNHDELAVMSQVLTENKITLHQSVQYKHWQIIMLDSTVAGCVGGHISEKELNRLTQILNENPGDYFLICLHHPPVATGMKWMDEALLLDNPQALFKVLDDFENIRCVSWGHVHQEFSAQRNGVTLLGTPSTMVQFKPDCEEFTVDNVAPGYRWFDLYEEGHFKTGVERVSV